MERKINLADAIKEGLYKNGSNISAAARSLETTSNTVRSWIYKNRFPRSQLSALASLAGLNSDIITLEGGYIFSLTRTKQDSHERREGLIAHPDLSLPLAFSEIDARVTKLRKFAYAEPKLDIKLFFGSLDERDLYIYQSLDQEPLETETRFSKDIDLAITKAIRKKAHLVYILPSEEFIRQMKRLRQRRLPDTGDLEYGIESLKNRIIMNGVPKEEVEDHVHIITTSHFAYAVPGHRYILLWPAKDRPRAMTSYPIAAKIKNGESNLEIFIPLSKRVTENFTSYIAKTVMNHEKDKEKKTLSSLLQL